jgi:predicted GNAT superfamily acetyltransferase
MTVDHELIEAASGSAAAAAERSEVIIRPLTELSEFAACDEVFSQIWGRGEGAPMPVNLLRALSSAGSYVVGAYAGAEMLGACVGFWAAPDRPAMHSHIAGVTAAARGRELGFALKLHQRAWALRCGVTVINWTFDPLIARNAHFNVRKLGGRAVKYAVNYYGEMPDAINAGDETDRMLLRWELDGPSARAACDGFPTRESSIAETVLVEVPPDIEDLRRTDREHAAAWRLTLRDRLLPMLERGDTIIDFDRRLGGYIVARGPS